ncbi:hypothetical protein [Vallitalea guaymasensis]|uniref:Lipoprotein n=1 Tax=Vallitalea guaymasensis TaxID=1185412 RepID=A0A8J8MCX5_9FIRM|nr:hypothetical protein [Vallitalea guaymasensis]QUH30573.1 hypothetical protein HYG85_17310 [Vallitalea guaymasensis]
MKKINAVGTFIMMMALVIILAACSKDNQDTGKDKIDELESKNEKVELIEEFTEMLKNNQNRTVMFGEFVDTTHYVYAVTDQLDKEIEKIMIVGIDENGDKVDMKYEGRDFEDDGDLSPIPKISKIFINQLKDNENPNVVVFREDKQYIKAQLLEVDTEKKAINYIGSCMKDKKTEEYTGDETYKYVMDFSEADYCSE